jgi:hypothetical protein
MLKGYGKKNLKASQKKSNNYKKKLFKTQMKTYGETNYTFLMKKNNV